MYSWSRLFVIQLWNRICIITRQTSKQIKFCKSCVVSNQRPNSTIEFKNNSDQKKTVINFDEKGICDACAVKKRKDQINWEQREQLLRELCDKHRSKNGKYDCLVPGSGGKDSFMQAHLLFTG